MNLEELKNQEVSIEERAESVVKELGLNGDERSVVIGLKKGDKFSLVAMNKVELTQQREGQTQQREGQARFIPITFTTDNGASIGAKHFAGVEIDDKAPAIGSTPMENAKFLVWCIDHKVVFSIKSISTEDIAKTESTPAYVKKTYKLEVEDYE